jgi:hypothetical protein
LLFFFIGDSKKIRKLLHCKQKSTNSCNSGSFLYLPLASLKNGNAIECSDFLSSLPDMVEGLSILLPHKLVFVFSRIESFPDKTYGVLGIECTTPLCLPLMNALESYVAQHLANLQFAVLTFENHRGYVRGGKNPYSIWADCMMLYIQGIYEEVDLKELSMRPLNYESSNFSKVSRGLTILIVSNHQAASQHQYDATCFAPFSDMVPPIGHEDWLIARPTNLREGGILYEDDMFR